MTNNETFYNIMINTDKDTIFIQLKDEKYKDVLAKVGHIEYTKDNEVEFEMELPAGQEKYYDDEKFTSLIQNAVYDIIAKSVHTYWSEAETKVIQSLEEKVAELMKPFDIDLGDKTYLQLFLEKGFMIVEDVDDNLRLMATRANDDKKYYFDDKDDFAFLRSEIGGTSLIV